MYQKVKQEKAAAVAERAKYEKIRNRDRFGGKDLTPEVFRKPVDIREDPRYNSNYSNHNLCGIRFKNFTSLYWLI